MKKTEKILKEEFKTRAYCDICGTKLTYEAHCIICNKDLCSKCIGHTENDGSDYDDCWCKKCWDTGFQYRQRIEELEKEIEKLYCDWGDACKNR